MENIETLLAAVAQTQGFDDDEPVVSSVPARKLGNSKSSPEIREDVGGSRFVEPPTEITGDARSSDLVTGITGRRKRGRPAKEPPVAKPPPPKRKQQQGVDDVEISAESRPSAVVNPPPETPIPVEMRVTRSAWRRKRGRPLATSNEAVVPASKLDNSESSQNVYEHASQLNKAPCLSAAVNPPPVTNRVNGTEGRTRGRLAKSSPPMEGFDKDVPEPKLGNSESAKVQEDVVGGSQLNEAPEVSGFDQPLSIQQDVAMSQLNETNEAHHVSGDDGLSTVVNPPPVVIQVNSIKGRRKREKKPKELLLAKSPPSPKGEQRQGFEDNGSLGSTRPAPEDVGCSLSVETPKEVSRDARACEMVNPPLETTPQVVIPVTVTEVRRKRGRPPKEPKVAKPLPPGKQQQGFDADKTVISTGLVPNLVNSKSSLEIREHVGGSHSVEASREVFGDGPAPKLENSKILPELREDVGGSQSVEVLKESVAAPREVSGNAWPSVCVTGTAGRRKRGKPPKGQLVAKPPPLNQEVEEEEDVCFICLDGGSLVLCDRKGCPKAYHPACIKRDEAFFSSNSKWTCGWHICSVCRKASYYMCYTCSYSLCKGCAKDEDYLRVRGNKGFCTTCIKTIMLIENKEQASSDSAVQVDFDDITSWEYLFKMYWVILKEKLSLTMRELTHAKKPWKRAVSVHSKTQLSNGHHIAAGEDVSHHNRSSGHLETSKLQVVRNEPNTTAEPAINKQLNEEAGDNRNIKGGAELGITDKEDAGNNIDQSMGTKNGKQETCANRDEQTATKNNSCKYAAINAHNMNLIYLRRNSMENLIEDKETFQDKVVGSITRIRISTDDRKPDIYRLVQVIGICKMAKPYKIGDKMADIMLEVLNSGQKEVVSIDAISNQEFTEVECRELDQHIRCGLLKQYTLDGVKKKAMDLQSVRFSDWLETELSRLYHLLDQASKKGCEEEVSEHVRTILLRRSPEERQRRISEVPEVHAATETGPDFESGDSRSCGNDTKGQHASPRRSGSLLNGEKPVSPNEKGKEEGSMVVQGKTAENLDASGLYGLGEHVNQMDIANSTTGSGDEQATLKSELEASTAAVSVANSLPDDNIEIEKLWHYRDSNGKIQGPYSMMHLRLLSTTGLLLPDTRIWTNHEQYDSLLLTDALDGKFHGASELPQDHSSGLPENVANSRNNGDSNCKQTDAAWSNDASISSENSGSTGADEGSWPKCWDLLKDKSSSAHDGPASLATDLVRGSGEINHVMEKNSSGPTETETTGCELHTKSTHQSSLASQSSEEKLMPIPFGLRLIDIGPESGSEPVSKSPISIRQEADIDISSLPSPKHSGVPTATAEKQPSEYQNVPMQNLGFLELLSPKPRSDSEDQENQAVETKQTGMLSFPEPNLGPSCSSALNTTAGGVQLPDAANDWCGYPIGLVPESSSKPPEITTENVVPSDANQFTHGPPPHPASSWLAMINEPIEFFDALGEESISDLLAECEMEESQRPLPSPASAAKFAKELMQDCKDDCFSSIEDFSLAPNPGKSDALSSTEIQLSHQPSVPCKPVGLSLMDALDSFSKSGVHSCGSSAGETNGPVFTGEASSEFHPPPPNTSQDIVGGTVAPGTGTEATEPGWGAVQGNINLVTVQGNVNLVLGGPQGMTNLGWGTSQGTWGNPSISHGPMNGSLPWNGQQQFSGERWGYQGVDPGYGRGRLPWGRPPYGGGGGGGGGGYSRPIPKGQRVCKFYESGRCKKGAFCDYLHP